MLTLGGLIDLFTIVSLKNLYADTKGKKDSTSLQKLKLLRAIEDFLKHFEGWMPIPSYISTEFPQNKVYNQESVEFGSPKEGASILELTKVLASINHSMWRNQEYVYDFSSVHMSQKDEIIRRCATLNIERNNFMDAINKNFHQVKREDIVLLSFKLVSCLNILEKQLRDESAILNSAKFV